jgi:catechol 2,3-dioxygenase-like lactoylglutathione lyase family enzyme
VFGVTHVEAAIAFYRDRLGFSVQFRMGEPATYAIVERGAVSLHLMPERQDPAALGRGRLYVFTDDVDALHTGLVAAGYPIEVAPQTFDYGMRECSVRDPDGNRITFGSPVAG